MGNGKERKRRNTFSKMKNPSEVIEQCRRKTRGQKSGFRQKKAN